MKTISYVIDPDGDIEIVHREPNSHQAIPKIHSDDCSTHTDLPDSDFDNPPATGRYTVFNELYTKSTTVTEVLRTSERNMGRGKSVCAFPQSTCPLCPAHSSIYCSLHPTKMHPLLIVLLALLLLLPLLSLSPGFTRLAEMPWLLPSCLMPSMDATQRSLELSTSDFLPESQPWSTITNARKLFTFSSAIGREISFAKLVFLQLPVRELFCKRAPLWLYICMVFPGQEGIFASMAPIVVVDFKGSTQATAGMLPITTTLRNLNENRLDPIEQINNGLQDVHNTLLKEPGCVQRNRICSSLTLGVLVHMVHQHEHSKPPFIAPFDGYSVSTALNLVKECSEPMPLHDNPGTERLRSIDANDGRTYPCSIKGRMTPVLQKIDRELWGMRPADSKD
ncbi:hypothetical protein FOBRF1_004769 [Fusarium oxysporum]